MNLKLKTALILAGGLLLNLLLDVLVQQAVIAPSFRELELREANDTASRCFKGIEREQEHLDTLCRDWSAWDDMYQYVQDRNDEFHKSNLMDYTLEGVNLSALFIFDAKGNLIKGRDLSADSDAITTASQVEQFVPGCLQLLQQHPDVQKPLRGVATTTHGPMIIVSRAILPSSREGTSRGTLVMARRLDQDLIQSVRKQVGANLEMWPLPDEKQSPILAKLSPTHTEILDNSVAVYQGMNDLLGQPVALVRATIPRDITTYGHRANAYATATIVAVSALVLLTMTIFMHRWVIRPIMTLTSKTKSLSTGLQGEAVDLRLDRQDELGALANQFHQTMSGLQYRDRLLMAAADATRCLLGEHKLQDSASTLLLVIGQSIGADRAFLYQLDKNHPGGHTGKLLVNWRADGKESDPQEQRLGLEPLDLAAFEALQDNRTAAGNRECFPPQAQAWLAAREIQSVLLLPVFAGGEMWGVLGLAQCDAPRAWDETECSLLQAVAGTLGSAVIRNTATEALLAASVRAEEASRAKSEFLAKMSHEIRTPMNGVIGMLDLLSGTRLDDRQRRYASVAKNSAIALLGLINDILDFSKIEAGKMELDQAEMDLCNVTEDAVVLLANRASEKGLELACQFQPDVPQLVVGDALRLRQVLVNLVGNAVKFTDSGTVSVHVKVQKEDEHSVELHFSVRDTGTGIPQDRIERLFNMFSQVDSSSTRKFSGTGLGLAICKKLSELMGGRIGVQSEVGKGSTFWFTARMGKTTAVKVANPEAVPPRSRLRVLAVDDNSINREVLLTQMGNWGFETCSASDAKAALEMLYAAQAQDKPIQMAILDMDMPGMNGVELARSIKSSSRLRETVLILLSSMSEQLTSQQLKDNGFAASLLKPVRQSELLDTILKVQPSVVAAAELPQANTPAAGPDESVMQRRQAALILLAEDNEINQEVAREILTAAGFQCEIVPNGLAAVEAVRTKTYDLVLMDCQMPEMDGFTASRTIRQDETHGRVQTGGREHLPIVALTANAIKGDRELCLNAGMDDYLSKPIDPERLLAIIDRLLAQCPVQSRGVATKESSAISPPAPVEAPVVRPLGGSTPASMSEDCPFDMPAALKRCMDNHAFLDRLMAKFATKLVEDVAELHQHVRDANPQKVAFVAHAIKGSAANLAAEGLREVASRLELAGRAGDFGTIEPLAQALQEQATRCCHYINMRVGVA